LWQKRLPLLTLAPHDPHVTAAAEPQLLQNFPVVACPQEGHRFPLDSLIR
jgi:hypothetical protein